MKETLYKSVYTQIYFHKDNELFEVVRPVPETITDDEFKSEFLKWKDLILEHKPKRQLVDSRDYSYTIVPEMQAWVDENVLGPSVAAGLRRVAFVVPPDFFSEISITQTMEENAGRSFKIMYFKSEDYDEAFDWLLEKPEVVKKYEAAS